MQEQGEFDCMKSYVRFSGRTPPFEKKVMWEHKWRLLVNFKHNTKWIGNCEKGHETNQGQGPKSALTLTDSCRHEYCKLIGYTIDDSQDTRIFWMVMKFVQAAQLAGACQQKSLLQHLPKLSSQVYWLANEIAANEIECPAWMCLCIFTPLYLGFSHFHHLSPVIARSCKHIDAKHNQTHHAKDDHSCSWPEYQGDDNLLHSHSKSNDSFFKSDCSKEQDSGQCSQQHQSNQYCVCPLLQRETVPWEFTQPSLAVLIHG